MTLDPGRAGLVALLLLLMGASVRGQTVDGRVLQLYASADYEQALEVLGSAVDPMAQQYRALCFLALGRVQEAEASVSALISAAPDFVVSGEDVPPRFAALVERVRRELLPAILRRHFSEARELYQAKAYDRALPAFERVLNLSAVAGLRQAEGVEDIRLLAQGFIDLAKAPREVARPEPSTVTAAAPVKPVSSPESTGPMMRRQQLPPWPGEAGRPIFRPIGAVQLKIDREGRVTAATMIKGLHPAYDQRLLTAAMLWEYAPATLNGVPVDSESVVEVRVELPVR